MLHQQVHFVSHVTREANLRCRAGSAARQACYTRWRRSALSAFLKPARQMLYVRMYVCMGVRACVRTDSPLTSSNGCNQLLTANTLHPHYEHKTVPFLSSASAVVRKTGVFRDSTMGYRVTFRRNVLLPKHAPEPNSVALKMQ